MGKMSKVLNRKSSQNFEWEKFPKFSMGKVLFGWEKVLRLKCEIGHKVEID